MKTYEQECEWHFATLGANAGDEGPNSAMSQTFSQFPCSALVRESIQNSLDAVVDEKAPVKVCFEYRELEKEDYPNFFKLSNHFEACLSNYSTNPTAMRIYPTMIDYMANTEKVGFIRVSDYNTKGMDYATNATDKTFYAFVRAAGVSVKEAEGSGGSFGFGKGAFFVMSPINTLMVSTKNVKGECFFEGVARLCTHRINDEQKSHMGFYDNNGGQPTSDPQKIPTPFKRDETGTSIGIMGVTFDQWKSAKDELVKEVLRNFFVAIYCKTLVVVINGKDVNEKDAIIIDAAHLEGLMQNYFPSLRDVRSSRANTTYNPRPYYEALKEEPIEAELPTLGKVRAYFKEVPENSTGVIFMRKPYMKVNKLSRNLGNFNGVFICDNEQGNAILGTTEPPSHDEWELENCKDKTKLPEADSALKEFGNFIADCLEKLLNLDSTESVQVTDLEKYLPSNNGTDGKAEKGNPFFGTPTGKYISESASRTTEGELKPYDPEEDKKGTVGKNTKGAFERDESGKDTIGTGGNNDGTGGSKPGRGDNPNRGTVKTDGAGNVKLLVDVEWRPVISRRKGYMDIVIYVDHDIADAELLFEIGRESKSQKSEDVTIVYSNKGRAERLRITGVELKGKAKNIIQVAFSDNMSHSLNLGVYKTIKTQEA